jgi:hypothetical protein
MFINKNVYQDKMPKKTGRSERIILELLHRPDGSLTKYRIAKETETNISWVITFLRRLENKKYIKGTKVIKVGKLIDEYLSIAPKPKSLDFFVKKPLEYLKKTKRAYALTTYAAENFTSYHLFISRIDAYIREEEIDKWKEELFRDGLIGKGNLRLLISKDEYIFKFVEKRKNLLIVSVPLLMIDLKREGGVCLEAYEYLVNKYV